MKRRLILIFLVLLLIAVVKEGHYLLTGGFKGNKIICWHNFNQAWEIPLDPSDEVKEILHQDFFYLGKGRQAYVFESADKKYVLKFVRAHRYKNPFWVEMFSLHDLFCDLTKAKKRRFSIAMNSYKIAFEKMKDETKVLYVHLNRNGRIKQFVTLKDALGRSLKVPLDYTAFFLQKKVVTIKEQLISLKKEHDLNAAKSLCSSFLQEIFARAKKGILNRDFINVMKNYGFDEGRVVEMDLGSFCLVPTLCESDKFKAEILRWTTPFKAYVSDEFPEITPFFELELQKLLDEGDKK